MNQEASILSVMPEEKFKIVIVGDTGVGKTTIFKYFLDEKEEDPTIKGTNLYFDKINIFLLEFKR